MDTQSPEINAETLKDSFFHKFKTKTFAGKWHPNLLFTQITIKHEIYGNMERWKRSHDSTVPPGVKDTLYHRPEQAASKQNWLTITCWSCDFEVYFTWEFYSSPMVFVTAIWLLEFATVSKYDNNDKFFHPRWGLPTSYRGGIRDYQIPEGM
jgi:hypothetical protein